MGDENMQISGIFSKIKMPNLNGGLDLVSMGDFKCQIQSEKRPTQY